MQRGKNMTIGKRLMTVGIGVYVFLGTALFALSCGMPGGKDELVELSL